MDNPIVQAVISTMTETEDYFFFAINPDNSIVAFRSELEYHDLAGLRANQENFGSESSSPELYEKAVKGVRIHKGIKPAMPKYEKYW